MRNFFIILVSILALSDWVFAQNETKPCPNISVTSPAGITTPGEIMSFSVKVEYEKPNLKYEWAVSAGTIIEGQHTSTIKVATTPEMSGKMVNAIATIEGLPKNCLNVFSEMAGISSAIFDPIIDSYGKISSREEKSGRLDNLFIQLARNPQTKAFINLRITKNESMKQAKKHVKQIIEFANFRKFPKERLVFAIEESNLYQTTFQIFREDEGLPECNNCEIIKGEDIK